MLLFINGLILIALAFWILLLATGWSLPYNLTLSLIAWPAHNPWQSVLWVLGMIGVGVILINNRRRPKKITGSKPVQINLPAGQLRIKQSALQDLLTSSCSEISGLKKYKFNIKIEEDGLVITVYCRIAEGYDYSSLALQIREKIRNLLEQNAGIKVKEVKVLDRPRRLVFPAIGK